MGFFQQIRNVFSSSDKPVPDLSFGLMDSLAIKPLLQQQRWEELEEVIHKLASDELTRLLDGLCLSPAYTEALTCYEQTGNSDLRQLIAGVHATFLAWQARGSGGGSQLSEKQVEGFLGHLNQAYEHLNRSFGTLTLQAEAAARLVRVAMGQSEPALAQEAFEYSLELVPAHLQAHLFYFNVLTPKWFGSEEALLTFVEAAPTPDLYALLQAMYLVELYQEIDDSPDSVKQKFRDDHAQRLNKLLLLRPLLTDTSLLAIYRNNYLAGLHHALGQVATRNEFLRELGPATTTYPWLYFGLSGQHVQKLAVGSK